MHKQKWAATIMNAFGQTGLSYKCLATSYCNGFIEDAVSETEILSRFPVANTESKASTLMNET